MRVWLCKYKAYGVTSHLRITPPPIPARAGFSAHVRCRGDAPKSRRRTPVIELEYDSVETQPATEVGGDPQTFTRASTRSEVIPPNRVGRPLQQDQVADEDIPSTNTNNPYDPGNAKDLGPTKGIQLEDLDVKDFYPAGEGEFGYLGTDTEASQMKESEEEILKYLGIAPATDGISKPDLARAKARVSEALRHGAYHELFSAVFEASRNSDYIGSLPPTVFIEILRLLSSDQFLEPYLDLYRYLPPEYVHSLRHYYGTHVPEIKAICSTYMRMIRRVAQRRDSSDRGLGLGEYTILLNAARLAGDELTANSLWTEMAVNRVAPDIQCYNHYLAARCWPLSSLRPAQRVLHHHGDFPTDQHLGGITLQEDRFADLKSDVSKGFAQMVERGIAPDVETFGLLMTAFGRVGDTKGVKSILKDAWNVDVDHVLALDSETEHLDDMDPTSPLRPNGHLLFVIANVFASNNDVPTALRMVDHVSRRFSVPIPTKVWEELLQWTHLLSKQTHDNLPREQLPGKLPLKSVENLWNIMTAEPYNVKPNMFMLDIYVQNLFTRQMFEATLSQIIAGVALHVEDLRKYNELERTLEGFHQKERQGNPVMHGQNVVEASRRATIARLKVARDDYLVFRWISMLINGHRWMKTPFLRIVIWQRQELPQVLEAFWPFRPKGPDGLKYHTHTGIIEIQTERQWRFEDHREVQRSLGAFQSLLDSLQEESRP